MIEKPSGERRDQLLQQLRTLEAHLANMDLPEQTKWEMLAAARSEVVQLARQALIHDAVESLASDSLAEERRLLAGCRLSVSVTFSNTGRITEITETLMTSQRLSKSMRIESGPRGKQRHIVNGTEYRSAAKAVYDLGEDAGSDSCPRHLQRMAEWGRSITSWSLVLPKTDAPQ